MHTFSKKLFVNIICNPSTKHTEHSAIRHFFPQCNCASASLQNGTRGFPWHSIRLSEITSPDAWSHKKKNIYFFSKNKTKKRCIFLSNRGCQRDSYWEQIPSAMFLQKWAKIPVCSTPFMSLGRSANTTGPSRHCPHLRTPQISPGAAEPHSSAEPHSWQLESWDYQGLDSARQPQSSWWDCPFSSAQDGQWQWQCSLE